MSIQLLEELVMRWKSCGANVRYSCGLCRASSHSTLIVADTTPTVCQSDMKDLEYESGNFTGIGILKSLT